MSDPLVVLFQKFGFLLGNNMLKNKEEPQKSPRKRRIREIDLPKTNGNGTLFPHPEGSG